mmetsp:Transcript_18765/g.44860  ORF Transcript_18765/g.44860 Transcript_18765/m.44860 type:complete len:390 (+) Transcript_18765:743-1912(+)
MRVAPELAAAARASVVLQQPGGPCRRTPRGALMPSRANASACCSGHSTACLSRLFTSSSPPMSSQDAVPPSASMPRAIDGRTFALARSKSDAPTGRRWPSMGPRETALSAASRQRAARSAPVKPWQVPARRDRSTSPPSGSRALCRRRMASRCSLDGTGMETSRSSRPGLRMAGSIALGRFVVPTTKTRPVPPCAPASLWQAPPAPSIRVSSWATTRPSCCRPRARLGANASISSSSTTTVRPCSADSFAFRNASRKRRSDSPWNAPKTDAAVTVCNSAPHSSATAATLADFPVPEGPCRRTPFGQRTPRADASSACSLGHAISSLSVVRTLSIPASLADALVWLQTESDAIPAVRDSAPPAAGVSSADGPTRSSAMGSMCMAVEGTTR